MSKTCNGCGEHNLPESVPYIVHESDMSRLERQLKRLWIVILVLIFLLVGSNCAWLCYESQFETVETVEEVYQEVVQDADNGENHFIGGDMIGETDNQNEEGNNN
jgi:hypothetical protein